MIPIQPIHTTRLILRVFCPQDADDLYEYLSDPSIYIFEPGEPITPDRAQSLAVELSSSPDFWAVELEAERKVIGQVYFNRIEPEHLLTWELGYRLSPKYQRHGYASEAALALVRYGFSTGQIHRVVAHCNPENTASWKLLEKIGFRREGLLHKNIYFRKDAQGNPIWIDTFVYAMLVTDESAN